MSIKLLQQSKSRRRAKALQRMDPLATLPVFYKLADKKVLIAGGTDAAAWKAELLAASGADVCVHAEQLDPIFKALIAEPRATGSLIWHKRPWAADSFTHMQMAICDAESEGEAKAFYCAARAAGVAVNVIDQPKFCEFQFGSIVNRSPTVIAISTDGAAPIFGQAIRRKIETLIAPSLKNWSELARDLRQTINQRLEMGNQRRAFWESFVDRAFGAAPKAGDAEKMIQHAKAIATETSASKGKVTLVGAGPGDAELLTLKAVRALQAADIILFDNLVSSDVLELARREAKRMLVGKRGGRTSCKQEDINAMMISLAKAGKNVVRLKGGDPMIFGRAGEEIAQLREAGIPVDLVPGITSALAMASQLGVSLTHRDHAQSVRFVTGHARNGELPTEIDWKSIADPKTTTIFYMGGRTSAQISQKLISEGLSDDSTIVISKSVSHQDAQRWVGPLRNLGSAMEEIGTDEPVLIGVGSVFDELRAQSNCQINEIEYLSQRQ